MKCRYSKYLSRYLDNELCDEKMAEIREHISSCSLCQQELKELAGVMSVLKGLSQVEVSDSYEYEFEMKLADRIIKKRWPEVVREKVYLGLRNMRRNIIFQPVMVRITAGILLFIGIIYSWFYYQDVNSLKVMGVAGEVMVLRGDKWIPAGEDEVLRSGDRIKVADNSFMDVYLKDRYRFRIKGGSEVKIEELKPAGKDARTYLRLARGRILVDIEEGYHGKEFKVKTGLGEAVAYGTEFSVVVDEREKEFWVGVLEGKVGVEEEGRKKVVRAGYKIEIRKGQGAEISKLTPEERRMLEEIRKIGSVMVSLVLRKEAGRVEEFLNRPRFYAFGKEPEEIKKILNRAGRLLNKALRAGDERMHTEVIEEIEKVVRISKDEEVKAKLMIFIAGYYRWLGKEDEAVKVLKEVIDRYGKMEEVGRFSRCALGEILEEMGRKEEARNIYEEVIGRYPGSLEAEEARARLNSLL
jgi:predicted anti-sigma-YlaC factor YlaD